MSFSATVQQVRDKTKTVTRRQGWTLLKPGDLLCAVEKGMGLKKGEKINRLATIRVVSVRREAVHHCPPSDVAREGFPDLSQADFVKLYCELNRCSHLDPCTRIEFEYV